MDMYIQIFFGYIDKVKKNKKQNKDLSLTPSLTLPFDMQCFSETTLIENKLHHF